MSSDEIEDILQNGRGMMPGNLVPPESLDAMVEWVMSIE